jgi:ribosomal protein S21
MRKKQLILTLALMMVFGAAQAQVTPQAVIDSVPALPSPGQWAANGKEARAFKAKISELENNLKEMRNAAISSTPNQAQQKRSAAQVRRETAASEQGAQTQQDLMAAMGITQDDQMKMAKMGQAEAQAYMMKRMQEHLELTDAEMTRMQSMSQADAQAFIMQRMQERGTQAPTQAELNRGNAALRRGSQNDPIAEAQKTIEAYTAQSQATSRKIAEAEQECTRRTAAVWAESEPLISKARAEAAAAADAAGQGSGASVERTMNRLRSLVDEYNTAMYRIWSEYVVSAQGHLKLLMPYAQAADDARKTQGAALGQLQGMQGNAIGIVSQYLIITGRLPEAKPVQ